MNCREELLSYSFSAEELYAACDHYVARMIASTEAALLDFEPSAAHREAIQRLIDGSLRRGKRHALYRRIAAIAAVAILFFSTVMVTNVHAREAVVRWLRQVFPDHVLYQFFGEPTGELYHYTIGWIPAGFELAESEINANSAYYLYESLDRIIIIEYYPTGTFGETEFFGYEEYTVSDMTINGMEAFVYQDKNSELLNVILFDQVRNLTIELDTDIGLMQTLKIAENLL